MIMRRALNGTHSAASIRPHPCGFHRGPRN